MNQQASYTQLNTFNTELYAFDRNDQFNPLITQKRTHFTRRDCILVVIVIVIACVMIAVTLALGLPKIKEKRERYFDSSFPVSSSILNVYEHSAVLSDGGPCASIGRYILDNNGSAVDAAIATLFCDGAVNPQSMGLGGGFFMTIYNKTTGEAKVIDARETAPSQVTVDMFQNNSTLSLLGGLAIAVPGELRGYWFAHQKFGKLDWNFLINPTIDLCKKGFVVGRHLADKIQLNKDEILKEPSMRELFYNKETDDLFKEGEMIKRPILAETLSKIANTSGDELYTGKLAASLVNDIRNFGGKITLQDMKDYKPLLKDAIAIPLNQDILYTVPTPGSGAILGFILNILRGYNLTADSMKDISSSVLTYHRMAEAFKYAYAERTKFGDDEETNKLISKIISPEYGDSIRANISDTKTFPPEHYGPVIYQVEDHGTAHLSVFANGDAVSVTSSINTQFGSKRRSNSTGIILNNSMDDFSYPNKTNYFGLPSSPANFLKPGKRPLSSMSPSVLVDKSKNVKMVIGGAGGALIPTAMAQVMVRTLWLKESLKKSVDALRLHHQLYPNYLQYEDGFPQIFLDNLKKYGHKTKPTSEGTVVLGIVKGDDGKIYTNVDHRKGGSSRGF
ncbi:glutathione hydrolase 1 proenzyme-like isoform X2 [Centruroides sculpturatus]|uniref:glutathione hydrolase 1 proenzyme-like isoform X2 n=2 Tax=Centruroides sculpturatus TaxID=218467 RepID=UPI000C6D9564|nr:glutathione hydrolase 1 proenzyme-like isoform X2 [Centruroides sculpturatus]